MEIIRPLVAADELTQLSGECFFCFFFHLSNSHHGPFPAHEILQEQKDIYKDTGT